MDAPLTASDGGAASSSTVPHATVSRSRRQHCGWLPVFNDFLQHRVRSRTIAALVPVFLFCLVVFGILRDFPDESDVVATVEFSSSPPVGAFFGFSLVRAPRVQVLTESQRGLEGVEVGCCWWGLRTTVFACAAHPHGCVQPCSRPRCL